MEHDKPPPLNPSFTDATTQAMLCLQQDPGNAGRAARLLLDGCDARLKRYIKQHSFRTATDEDVEEILQDTIMSFVTEPIPLGCSADAWLFTITRHTLTNWWRKRQADKRGVRLIAGDLDDETLGSLLETTFGYTELPPWVRSCIEKAAAYMQQVSPQRAEMLFMMAEGWSAKEIAIHFGASPHKEVSEKQLAAARDRRFRAKAEAKKFFEHCLE